MSGEIKVKRDADTWVPVVLIDDEDFKTPETAKTYSDVSVEYANQSDTSMTTLTMTSGKWRHLGTGYYELLLTSTEKTENGRFKYDVTCTGCLPYYGFLSVRDDAPEEEKVDVKKWAEALVSTGGGYPRVNMYAVYDSPTTGSQFADTISANGLEIDQTKAIDFSQADGYIGQALAATSLGIIARGSIGNIVSDAGNSTIQFKTDLTEATDNHFNGMIVLFTYGNLKGQTRQISDYDGTNKIIHVDPALTETPSVGDDIVILPPNLLKITNKTDGLNFTGIDVKATLDGEEVTVGTNNDKTGYRLSTTGVQDIWEHTTRALTDKAGFTISGTLTTLDALNTQLNTDHGSGSWETATGFSTHSAADVWSVATRSLTDKAGFTLSGTIQTFDAMKTDLNTDHGSGIWETATGFSTHTAAQVADAVWDELITGHTSDGSFGKAVNSMFQEGVSAKDIGSAVRVKLGQFYKRVNYSTYTGAGKPKTGTIKYYSTNGDFVADTNPTVTFNFTATWSSELADAYITEFELQKT